MQKNELVPAYFDGSRRHQRLFKKHFPTVFTFVRHIKRAQVAIAETIEGLRKLIRRGIQKYFLFTMINGKPSLQEVSRIQLSPT